MNNNEFEIKQLKLEIQIQRQEACIRGNELSNNRRKLRQLQNLHIIESEKKQLNKWFTCSGYLGQRQFFKLTDICEKYGDGFKAFRVSSHSKSYGVSKTTISFREIGSTYGELTDKKKIATLERAVRLAKELNKMV